MRQLKTKRGAWFKYSNLDFEIGWLISREAELTFLSERPFSINGASPESNSWGVKNPQASKRNLDRMLAQGGQIDGWSEDFIKNFVNAGGDFHFFYMLPVTVFGTTIKFLEEFGLELKDEIKINFAKILVVRAKTMASREAFDWYISNAKIFLELFFKKKVKFEDPTYSETSNNATISGLIKHELWFQRNKFTGSYEDLARFIFSLLPSVKS